MSNKHTPHHAMAALTTTGGVLALAFAATPAFAANPCAARNPCAAKPMMPNPCAVKNPCAPKSH